MAYKIAFFLASSLVCCLYLTGCATVPLDQEKDLKDDQLIATSRLFTPKNASRIKEKEADESAIEVGKRKSPIAKNNGLYALMEVETGFSLRKPSLENARKCSFNASLPKSQESDLVSCSEAIKNKDIGTENLVSTYLNRGMIYTKIGQLEAAAADFDKAEAITDNLGDVYFSRGIMESYRYDYAKMAELISKSIKMGVRDKEKAYFFLGGAYELNFEFDAAREAYENSLKLNPNSQKVQKALSRLNGLWPD